jgi:TRAP-type C4-dicarboxylate transport system permease small subunit
MIVRVLQFIDEAIQRLNVLAQGIAAVFIGFIAVVGTADVIGTAAFGMPVPSALELSEAGLVIVVFMGLAYAQRRRAHVAVDIFTVKFSGIAHKLAVGLALASAAAVFGFLAWRGGIAAEHSIGIGERSEGLARIPLYPGKLALSFGCLIAMLEALRQLVHLCLGRADPEGTAPRGQELPE